jgi:hypothetical protein
VFTWLNSAGFPVLRFAVVSAIELYLCEKEPSHKDRSQGAIS